MTCINFGGHSHEDCAWVWENDASKHSLVKKAGSIVLIAWSDLPVCRAETPPQSPWGVHRQEQLLSKSFLQNETFKPVESHALLLKLQGLRSWRGCLKQQSQSCGWVTTESGPRSLCFCLSQLPALKVKTLTGQKTRFGVLSWGSFLGIEHIFKDKTSKIFVLSNWSPPLHHPPNQIQDKLCFWMG